MPDAKYTAVTAAAALADAQIAIQREALSPVPPTGPAVDHDKSSAVDMKIVAANLSAWRGGDGKLDPLTDFARDAGKVTYFLRDALKSIDNLRKALKESKTIRDDLKAKGLSPDLVENFLQCQETAIWLAKQRCEMQLFGRTFDNGH